jgi:hypothetical protein
MAFSISSLARTVNQKSLVNRSRSFALTGENKVNKGNRILEDLNTQKFSATEIDCDLAQGVILGNFVLHEVG